MKLNIKFSLAIFSILITWYLSTVNADDRCFQDDGNSSYDVSPHLQHVSEFTFDFFRSLLRLNNTKNLVVSPYSIWNALALVYLGTAGRTEEQLKRTLKIDSKENTLKKWRAIDFIYLMRQLETNSHTFGLVNKAYFDKNLKLRECIHEVLREELQLIDFQKTEMASKIINEFVSENTNDLIKSIAEPKDMEGIKMALVNAAFFSDKWKYPFNKNDTEKSRFYPFNGEEEYVEMMRVKANFKYGVSEELRAHVLELPYTLNDISMFVFLPPSVEGEKAMQNLISSLTEETVEKAIDETWLENIEVSFPKVVIETSLDDELKTILKGLGITDLFEHMKSNLTTFVPNGQLSVSKVLHETYIEISEEGTEAASATVVLTRGRSARPGEPLSFTCDHPFVFSIYDKFTKNVLFMGRFEHGFKEPS
ncbi:UNVERIFIED_CONTAM: hypothetical protein RMT77_007131 [Armadillidium vulgare]